MIDDLTPEEMTAYLELYYGRLLEHRYYVLAAPVLEDSMYDYIERDYNALAEKHGGKIMDMVDFDPEDGLAQSAKIRVDSNLDSYSLWEKEMEPVRKRLGKPAKEQKKEKQ